MYYRKSEWTDSEQLDGCQNESSSGEGAVNLEIGFDRFQYEIES